MILNEVGEHTRVSFVDPIGLNLDGLNFWRGGMVVHFLGSLILRIV